jgi:large subunit ribosomal protein L24
MIKRQVKKNDLIEVITGTEKGKRGKVLRVMPEKGRLMVEKIKMVKRHVRPTGSRAQSGVVEKEASLAISNVMVVCGKCDRAGRVGRRMLADGKKARYCRNCGELLEG